MSEQSGSREGVKKQRDRYDKVRQGVTSKSEIREHGP